MGRPKKSERTYNLEFRDHILDTAEIIFAQKGYAATTTREICKTAGVNKNLIYYYFHNKSNLYGTILQRNIGPIISDLLSILVSDREFDDKLDFIIDTYYTAFDDKSETLPKLMARELADGAPFFSEYIASQVFKIQPLMSAVFHTESFSFENYYKLTSLIAVILYSFLTVPLINKISELTGIETPSKEFTRQQIQLFIHKGVKY